MKAVNFVDTKKRLVIIKSLITLNMDLITKDEYNKKATELKKVILGN